MHQDFIEFMWRVYHQEMGSYNKDGSFRTAEQCLELRSQSKVAYNNEPEFRAICEVGFDLALSKESQGE